MERQEKAREMPISISTRHTFPQSDRMPDKRLFSSPISNTWIEYASDQSGKNTLEYAGNIVEAGFESGVLMIEDSWA